jgi:hypothetical protein
MANFSFQDGYYIRINTPLNQLEQALLESQWEGETDYDVKHIEKELLNIKKLKKVCLVKFITLPLESLVAYFTYSKKDNDNRKSLNSIYIKFLFNKINYQQFKNDLLKLSKNDIILL